MIFFRLFEFELLVEFIFENLFLNLLIEVNYGEVNLMLWMRVIVLLFNRVVNKLIR